METVILRPPDVCWESEADATYRPSWSGFSAHINTEHAGIWQATQAIPGWQAPADSEKLYEMAYYNGAVILEIGMFGGRSATVELRGALRAAAEASRPRPQYYGVDISLSAVTRTYQTLHQQGLAEQGLLFHGDLGRFHQAYAITPSMVFVDGDHEYFGAWSDLDILRTFLAPGTAVLCHDYWGYPGVKQAVDEWKRSGFYDWMGVFGCSALLRTTGQCTGQVRGLEPEQFARERKSRLVEHLEAVRLVNAELEQRVQELSASRWRKLGLKIGLAKQTSWERSRSKSA